MLKKLVVLFLLCCAACGTSTKPAEDKGGAGVSTGSDRPATAAPASAPTASAPKPTSDSNDLNNADLYVDPPADLVAGLGVDVYPGAKVMKYMTGMKSTGSGNEQIRDTIFFTRDPASKVADFYKAHLPEAKVIGEIMQNMNVYALDGKNAAGDATRVQAQGYGGITHIHIVITKP